MSDKPKQLFLMVPDHEKGGREWRPIASSTSLFYLEKVVALLNCVTRWKVVQPMGGHEPGGGGHSIVLKRYPKQ
jgi:hypothetical protein